MTIVASKYLIRLGALVLIACAVLHSLAWTHMQADLGSKSRATVRLTWFLLTIDWLVIAGLWLLASSQLRGARWSLLLSSVVPISVAVGLFPIVGTRFPPIYLQLCAAALVIVGALNTGD
jgi:hypothetical protein